MNENVFDARAFDAHWQSAWEERGIHRARGPGDPGFDPARPKFYVLDMFPYPSGSGLHVGHAVGYVGSDVVARRKRMEGFEVLHPMGWDAFGLPAEQYAIQTGVHPRVSNRKNTDNFRSQLKKIGLSFDWSRELDTSDPKFFRWTQWLFKRLYEHGLAYQADVPVWWCEELKTVLANEEVINGRSERGNYPCVRRPLKQWMLKITAYAERLLADLDGLDWPESIKTQQREWIGKSEGAEIHFPVEGRSERLSVFTTRPDTLFGATFMVVAPEHPLLATLQPGAHKDAVEAYVRAAASKSDLERTDLAKEKSGVFTGLHALNPLDPKLRLPIWVADYVLFGYGTGAIMSVPGHDARDLEFARKFDLRVVPVVRPAAAPVFVPPFKHGDVQHGHTCVVAGGKPEWCFTGDGTAVSSPPIEGLATPEAKRRIVEVLAAADAGAGRTTYKLRDWLFSRQRYWGEPFPLVHTADGKTAAVGDTELPIDLPELADFKPSADGSAPLARAKDWLRTQHQGRPATRDVNTMPGWAGSCWYWLRFMDPHNAAAPFSKEAERFWGPVDLYVGGASHAVMHLLYSRFWHKVLFDLGIVSTNEPFQRLFNQGMITAFAYEDATGRLVASDQVNARGDGWAKQGTGEPLKQIVTKMAKSLKNVVNPDDVIAEHGADAFRLYELFMGPLADSKPWDTRAIPGCRRFVERVWRLFVDEKTADPLRPALALDQQPLAREGANLELERFLNKALARVDDSFRQLNFNTAIAALMELLNEIQPRAAAFDRGQATRFVAMLAPFAPHLAEELWRRLGNEFSVHQSPWPTVDARLLVDDTIEMPVQVLGKVRGRVQVAPGAPEDDVVAAAKGAVESWIQGKTLVKTIVVPGKLVNFVVR